MRFLHGFLASIGILVLVSFATPAQLPPPIVDVPGEVEVPNVPRGVEVQARGPVHEAFATPTAEAKPTQYVPKKPPAEIEELPPDEKPEGDVVWIGGYWAWDNDRDDFLWVSGCWRIKPPGKEWVPGYWRDQAGQFQWVPGFWTTVQETQRPEVTYYPEPPPPPALAPPGNPPEADTFHVPGYWMWVGNHYVWRAGYWTRHRPGYVYVASHYRWSPFGFVFVPGYWDIHIGRRGVLYAPIVVTASIGPRFVYTPYYAVTDTIVFDAFFVRPGHCHYYFGDYYGPRYSRLGFECGYHYSRRHYDAIITYSRWEYRDSPGWFDVRLNVTLGRSSGRVAPPPRTLVQQINVTKVNNVTINNTVINNTTINNTKVNNTKVSNVTALAPAKSVMASKGVKSVNLDEGTRSQIRQSASLQNAVVKERKESEKFNPGTAPTGKPRTTALKVAPSNPVVQSPAGLTPTNINTGNNNQGGNTNRTVNPGKNPNDTKTPSLGTVGTDPKKPNLTTDDNRTKFKAFNPNRTSGSTGTKTSDPPRTSDTKAGTTTPTTPSVRPTPTPSVRPTPTTPSKKSSSDDKKKKSS